MYSVPCVLFAFYSCSETRIGILRGSESSLDLSRVIQLSKSPKVFLYDGFLSAAECDYLTLMVWRHATLVVWLHGTLIV